MIKEEKNTSNDCNDENSIFDIMKSLQKQENETPNYVLRNYLKKMRQKLVCFFGF